MVLACGAPLLGGLVVGLGFVLVGVVEERGGGGGGHGCC